MRTNTLLGGNAELLPAIFGEWLQDDNVLSFAGDENFCRCGEKSQPAWTFRG